MASSSAVEGATILTLEGTILGNLSRQELWILWPCCAIHSRAAAQREQKRHVVRHETIVIHMNEQAAYALIDAELGRLRQLPYSKIVSLIGKPETKEVVGEDGKSYQLEIETCWDGTKGKDVRVTVAADDGGWRAVHPLTKDFVIRPDGSFVGEFHGGSRSDRNNCP